MTPYPEYVRPLDLPDFDDPPVSEVVLSVRFSPLEVGTIFLGSVGQELFGADLPKVDEQPPVVMPIEELEAPARGSELRLELLERPPTPRFWFMSDSGNELVQIQEDFFARNWRRADGSDLPYPHYDAVRTPFVEGYEAFADALSERAGKSITAIQCEVTYVNHLLPGKGWTSHGEIARILRLARESDATFLPRPESSQLVSKFLIEEDATPIGRLHVTAQPAYRRTDQLPVFILTLTARGNPLGEDLTGVVRFMDIGHEWIVRGFKDVTTPEMHGVWRLKNG
jgi:uncharacterized protein (TIGR04255 family)